MRDALRTHAFFGLELMQTNGAMAGGKVMRNSGREHSLPKAAYTITVDVVHALVLERDGLTAQMKQRDREIQALRTQLKKLLPRTVPETISASMLSDRSETTYLHIVGALLRLLLGQSPSGQPYSSFRSEDAIMSALIATHGHRLGISERTLQAKFAAAKRALPAG